MALEMTWGACKVAMGGLRSMLAWIFTGWCAAMLRSEEAFAIRQGTDCFGAGTEHPRDGGNRRLASPRRIGAGCSQTHPIRILS